MREEDDPTLTRRCPLVYRDSRRSLYHAYLERAHAPGLTFSVIFLRPEACCKSSKSWEYEAT